MIKSIVLISGLLMLHKSEAQWKGGAEQYFSFSSPALIYPSVMVNYQSPGGMYTEARFQYDMDGSFSLNAGKSFSSARAVTFVFRPMLGVMVGTYSGINVNLNFDAEWKDLFFSAKSQHTFSISNNFNSFFYSWLEGGYGFSKNLYAGISTQVLLPGQSNCTINKGFFIGLTAGNWEFPVYLFDPFAKSRSLMAGIIFNKQFKKNR